MIDLNLQKADLDADVFTLFGQRGVSFTRNFELSEQPFGDISENKGYVVRIAVDGDRLSDRVKVKPVAGLTYNFNDRKEVLSVKSGTSRVDRSFGEAEELALPASDLLNIKEHIIAVDFIVTGNVDHKVNLIELTDKIKSMGYKSNIYRKWRPVRK